jgi:hypothetical protein
MLISPPSQKTIHTFLLPIFVITTSLGVPIRSHGCELIADAQATYQERQEFC